MKKTVIILIFVLLASAAAFAVPAWRGLMKYTQPDGTVIMIRKHGDEFCHWTTDSAGNRIELDADGFYRKADSRISASRRNAAMANRERRYPAFGTRDSIALGQKHFLVILVEFSDVPFKSPNANEDFSLMLNQQGYNLNGGTGSARDFYFENSSGKFEPIFDVYGPVKLPHPMEYYGGNIKVGNDETDKAPEEAVSDGCKGLDDKIDFSIYDNDNDGRVDLVFMYYAGYGEADSSVADSIWPHQWSLSSAGITLNLDGKRINKYACSNELDGTGKYAGQMGGIGTVCHEFGHAIGLPDFYDTNYTTDGSAGGLYAYSTMCDGPYNNNGRTPPYFNIEERMMLGWIDETALKTIPKSGSYTLPCVTGNVAWKTDTGTNGEYFVYECRNKTGWDTYIPEAGMIVYHVDKSARKVKMKSGEYSASDLWNYWEITNSINASGSHPCFYIVPAGKQKSLNYGGTDFAFPGGKNITDYSPEAWDDFVSDLAFSGIEYDGTQISAQVYVPTDVLDYNVIANPGNGSYRAGEEFTFTLEEVENRPVAAVQWFFDDEPAEGPSVVLRAGTHTVEAVLTLADGCTRTVTLEIEAK